MADGIDSRLFLEHNKTDAGEKPGGKCFSRVSLNTAVDAAARLKGPMVRTFSTPAKGAIMHLMNFEEMRKRYDGGEDSLALTLEKWERIFQNSKTVFHLQHFQDILKAAVVPIFLCAEYANQCRMCPIFSVCRQGASEEWINLLRVLQAYAIAGDMLPRDTLLGHIERFLHKLKACRDEAMTKSN